MYMFNRFFSILRYSHGADSGKYGNNVENVISSKDTVDKAIYHFDINEKIAFC